jgi:Cdc6-like AAA superfamily ATPase
MPPAALSRLARTRRLRPKTSTSCAIDSTALAPRWGRSNDHAALSTLEDRLGLTPKARRQLTWELERSPPRQVVSLPVSIDGDPHPSGRGHRADLSSSAEGYRCACVWFLDGLLARKRRRRDPGEVFTPKSVVSREMFARRNEPDLRGRPGLQDQLREALRERGGQILMYGDTGVGKSSLLKYAAQDEHMEPVTIECFSQRTYEQVIEECIGRLVDFTEVSFTESHAVGSQTELSIGPPKLMSVKGTTKAEYGTAREFRAVQKEPIEVLLQAMDATSRKIVVLDNFQNVDDDRVRQLVAQTMERLSDRALETGDKKVVVIGIADDAPALLAGSVSFTRRTAEIGVPRMPDDEIEQVLETGFHLLGLDMSGDVLARLVFHSDGFPYFAHLLGQSVAKAARRKNAATIDSAMVDVALVDAASQVDKSYESRVRKALEAGGDTQPRKRILEMLAYDDRREWSSADVIQLFTEQVETRDDWSFLHSALAALTGEKHGAMLKRTGTAGKYMYKFNDPHMRPYLRLATFPRELPLASGT